MWLYRVDEPHLGALRIREWRRRVRHTIGLLILLLVGAVVGLVLLDRSNAPTGTKLFAALWDGMNLVTTLGDFSEFDEQRKVFMLVAMVATMLGGGYAVTRLTGMLSGDDVMAYRENRAMERKLEKLANHVVVVGFDSLGELVAGQLREAGETVLVLVADRGTAERACAHEYMALLGPPGVFDDVLRLARLDCAKALVVTTHDADNKLTVTLMAHTLNPALAIAAAGENDLRKALLESAGASDVVIGDELIANALVSKLFTRVDARI
ncbi:potassium transporter TrkA [Burkholderiaceae bacterium 16]|nr:potassium transporter TrkA [Burkholderiaceae bacterium 16]